MTGDHPDEWLEAFAFGDLAEPQAGRLSARAATARQANLNFMRHPSGKQVRKSRLSPPETVQGLE